MQEEIKTALRLIIGRDEVRFVLQQESWIIVEGENKKPRLEKSRYFSFMGPEDKRPESIWYVDVTCMTPEAEKTVREFIREELGLKRFEPGEDDPSSLLEAWA